MSQKITCISIDLINADKPPAALAFLAGACESVGADYQCISLNSKFLADLSSHDYNTLYSSLKLNHIDRFVDPINRAINNILDDIQKFKSDVVLVSVFSFLQYQLAVFFLECARNKLPGITIIAGGPGIGSEQQGKTIGSILLDADLLDYYCLGEGDELLVNFLNGKRSMLGLNHKGVSESWVPQLSNLDVSYLIPSYKKINTSAYSNLENKSNIVFSINTSRGCVRSCNFCDVSKIWNRFRFRSGNQVAKEILKHHQEVGAVHFAIVDSLINGSLKSFQEFNQAMIKLKQQYPSLADFSYNGMFIVRDKQSHDEEFFKTMSEAGCESLAIGVETGSDRLRFDMNKKFTNRDLDHHLEMCQKYKIQNNFLMFIGYPTETKEDFEQTLAMLDRYQKYLIDGTIIGINHAGVFSMITDSPLHQQREELGIVVDDDNTNGILSWNNINNPDLTIKERVLRDLEFRKHAIKLRYPIPYANRYLEYLKNVSPEFLPISD